MSWQKILTQGFSSASALLKFLNLPVDLSNTEAEKEFITRVPLGFAKRMQPGNANDPLLLQVLATSKELLAIPGYDANPLGEIEAMPKNGLMHKYYGRVLLLITGGCVINCRYCFRRHFPYQQHRFAKKEWSKILDYIRQDPSIYEVILSGGDPLLIADSVLLELLQQLTLIKHVRILRFHTRIPIVLPERIDKNFLNLLTQINIEKVIVLHCNHVQELDASVQQACQALRNMNCYLFNHTVLLKDINNNADTLAELSKQLFAFGILPYYLHLLDKVNGAAHFDMPEQSAVLIYRELQKKLPGYLLPRLVREKTGEASKTLIV